MSDDEIVEKWRQALRMHSKPSRLAKLIALQMADELEKDGVTDADIDRLFPDRNWQPHPDQTSPMTVGPEAFLDESNPKLISFLLSEDFRERLLDAQQDINLAANSHMDQALCNASALIDEIDAELCRLVTP